MMVNGFRQIIGVTALEDKIVQRATVEVLNAIYETDFLGFSYGFRPGLWRDNQGEKRATIRMRISVATRPRVA